MIDYQQLRTDCKKKSFISKSVIDDFLIHFVARKSNLEKEMQKITSPFRHIIRELPKEWLNMLMSQYIAHRIFKENGLIHKYLKHSGLRQLSDEETEFLKTHATTPWRYSFSQIINKPAPDFFEMWDIFTDETYLLYSPSISKILEMEEPTMWFNLIGSSGECWETYGPILHFISFEPEDILFYARDANGDWYVNGDEVMEDLEENPIPFSMLVYGSRQPRIFNKEYQVVHNVSEFSVEEAFHSEMFREDFKIEYSQEVYRLTQKKWGEFPHFNAAYYVEDDNLIVLESSTDFGYRILVETLNRLGYTLTNTPDERVTAGMKATAGIILKKDPVLNHHSHVFTIETPPEEKKEQDKMNAMLTELIPYINNHQTPDLDALATKYDVDLMEVKMIYEMIKEKIK